MKTLLIAAALLAIALAAFTASRSHGGPSAGAVSKSTPALQSIAAPPLTASVNVTNSATENATLEQLRTRLRVLLIEAQALIENDREGLDRLTAELMAMLTERNTAGFFRVLSDEEFHTHFGTKALGRWLELDADAALRWLEQRPDANDTHAWLVARRLVTEQDRLLAYCDTLAPGTWREAVLTSASAECATTDPKRSVGLAERLSVSAARTSALETAAYAWYTQDVAAANAWANTAGDLELRERLLAVGSKAIANADPDLAAGWLATAVKSEPLLTETALSVVDRWVDQQPAKAAAWVARFPEGIYRRAAIERVFEEWRKSEPFAAEAWLQTMPERNDVLAGSAGRAVTTTPNDQGGP